MKSNRVASCHCLCFGILKNASYGNDESLMNSVTCAKPSGPGGFGQYLILSYSTSSSGTFVNFISPENYLFPVYFQIIEMNLDIILKFKNLSSIMCTW